MRLNVQPSAAERPVATPIDGVPVRLWLALVLMILPILALIGLQAYQWARRTPRLTHDRRLVARTTAAIDAAQALKTALQDAERGQRGYLLTGEPVYLQPYRSGVLDIPALLSKLNFCARDLQHLCTHARARLRSMQRRKTLVTAFWKQAELHGCH